MDPRVQATVRVLEELFRETFPINRNQELGLAYGRYRGDHYYGGNPWFLITAYYAQFYFRLALSLLDGESLLLNKDNLEFSRALLPESSANSLESFGLVRPGSAVHNELIANCVKKADRILARLRAHTPPDGQLYEQFDKVTGKPASSRGIGWSHSALIAALLERRKVFAKSSASPLPIY